MLLGSITGPWRLVFNVLPKRSLFDDAIHSGGTDICSLFAGMCTALPVYRGEIQCRLPGMAIEAFTPSGDIAGPDHPGELVCLRPFPCMPVGFWPLPGYGSEEAVEAAKVRYQQAYFSEFKGVWCECSALKLTCGDHSMFELDSPWRSCHGHAF